MCDIQATLLHPPLRPGRIALLRERRPVDARCPCCDGLLEETAAAEASVDLSDARPGDRWCPNCAWLLLREALTRESWWPSLTCPSHGPVAGR